MSPRTHVEVMIECWTTILKEHCSTSQQKFTLYYPFTEMHSNTFLCNIHRTWKQKTLFSKAKRPKTTLLTSRKWIACTMTANSTSAGRRETRRLRRETETTHSVNRFYSLSLLNCQWHLPVERDVAIKTETPLMASAPCNKILENIREEGGEVVEESRG